jgi:hypothetical protein
LAGLFLFSKIFLSSGLGFLGLMLVVLVHTIRSGASTSSAD